MQFILISIFIIIVIQIITMYILCKKRKDHKKLKEIVYTLTSINKELIFYIKEYMIQKKGEK